MTTRELEEKEMQLTNAGANGLAHKLLEDNGHGEMSPGLCADALALVRRLKAERDVARADSERLASALEAMLDQWSDDAEAGEIIMGRNVLAAHRAQVTP